MTTLEQRLIALSAHTGENIQALRDENSNADDDTMEFEYGNQEFLVLNDSEADEKAEEYIKESLWAFNASFILSQCGLPQALEEAIQALQSKECESCNDTILEMIGSTGSLQDFVSAAISADGRGHFMSSYDGEENEYAVNGEYLYIYRIN
jgi:hypothetical protein